MTKKKQQRAKKPPAAKPEALPQKAVESAPAKPKPAPAPAPVFWFGFDVAWAKVWVVRVVLFGLLAIDAILQIRHAPRYGAGGFNVAQLPGLDALGPTRGSYEIAQLISAYLFVLAAFGVATRVVVPIGTALYAWMYFTSQLDSYQHHYLVALVLGIACFVPWQRPADAAPSTPVRSWALRLILVQLGILYLWAAISKIDTAWLDGTTLSGQIGGSLRELIDDTIGIKAAARLTILAELVLAFTVWIRPAWVVALPLGLAFHGGILASGLEIGLFAYLMLGIYTLIVPDRFWVTLAELPPVAFVREALGKLGSESDFATGVAVLAGAGLSLLAASLCRLEHAMIAALVLGLVPLAIVVVRRVRGRKGGGLAGVAHLAAILVWLAVDRGSTVANDYYRFWGGSSRRLGDLDSAERAYRKAVALDPDDGNPHFQLGRILLQKGNEAEGLDELHLAQAAETARARSYLAEAQYLASKGRTAAAIEKAKEATYAEPGSKDANALVEKLTGAKPAAGSGFAPGSGPTLPNDDDAEKP